MKERIDSDIRIVSFAEIAPDHIFHNVFHIRGHPAMIARHALGETRCPTCIEDIRRGPRLDRFLR